MTPSIRQELMKLFIHLRVEEMVNQRAADLRAAGVTPGPEGSLGKLLWTEGMRKMSDVVSALGRPRAGRRQRTLGHLRVE